MSSEIHELDVVALTKDLPEEGVAAGEVGTVVFVHNKGEAFEIEFMLEPRRSVVATVYADHLLKLRGLGYSRAAG